MAWLTSPIFKPGDADADIAAMVLGGGRSSRLYKKLVYELQIAQDVNVVQQSLILGSQFQITVTARPGHTLDEIERAVDAELQALRTTPPDAREVERARNTLRNADHHRARRARRLWRRGRSAEFLQPLSEDAGVPAAGHRALSRRHAGGRARVREDATDAVLPRRRARGARARRTCPSPPTPPAAPSAPGQGAESVNVDEPWRKDPPAPPASRTYMQVPTPESITLANGLTVMLAPRRGLPVVAANLVIKTGSDSNPADAPGPGELRRGDADPGHDDAQRAADCRRHRAAGRAR